jgi:predicted nucleic acid-binding protein
MTGISFLIDTDWVIDHLIAASSLRHNLTLLTNNRRHFEHIEGLRIESLD